MTKAIRRGGVDPLNAVVERNYFYQSSYHRLMVVFVLSAILNIMLGVAYIYLLRNPPLPVFFATSVGGEILPVYPLDVPNQSDASVLEWAEYAAMAAFTYNYSDYRGEFQASSDFFSSWGWTQFLDAIKNSNNLDAVKAKKLVVSAQLVKGAPSSIQKSGVISGRYAWRVKIPLIVTYQSTKVYTQQYVSITMLVVRLSNLNSPAGIGIEQFVVAPQ